MYRATIYKVCITIAGLTAFACSEKKPERIYPTQDIEPYYGLAFTDVERDSMQERLKGYKESYEEIHKVTLPNHVGMRLYFDPLPHGFEINKKQLPINWNLPKVTLPANKNDLAFYPVYKLASLLQSKAITSTELTQLYLERLKRYGDTLHCVITITEEVALAQAKKADEEIAAGKYKGLLHGIPYGIKDLLAVEGTKTTWGAEPYKDQTIDQTATVVRKLQDAGAVMVAKLTMGALAMGDIWYGGKTRDPWDLEIGSSGSSAGSASATSAGLVAFAIGTETRGSIVSPSTRCGVSGLRPTFGAVSRYGAMTLSWSMDKIGPICRSALDCAIVFNTIRGEDGLDKTVTNAAFNYNAGSNLKDLKVGYLKNLFDNDTVNQKNNEASLAAIRKLGIEPEPVELPNDLPLDAMGIILTAEGAAAFDELTRSNKDDQLVNQLKWAWPNTFRAARFIPAVEYINALRLRDILIEEYYEKTKDYDVIITPSFGGDQLGMTNLTGHPCLVVPNGFDEKNHPTSISFLGKLYGEAALISIGRAFQESTEWDKKHPPLFVN